MAEPTGAAAIGSGAGTGKTQAVHYSWLDNEQPKDEVKKQHPNSIWVPNVAAGGFKL